MKWSSFQYLTKQGLHNLRANRLMSLASIGVLTACLAPLFFRECTVAGGLSLLLSLFNILLFQRYERRLNTSRCARCHTRNLRIHRCGKGLYKLYCPHCGLHNRWHSWRYSPEER